MALFHTTVLDNQIKALPTVDTASGSIASFDTDLTENLVSVKCQIVAKQASGTPSPDNPLPITTYTEMNVKRCGVNIYDTSTRINGYYISESGVITPESNSCYAYVKVNEGETYTFSGHGYGGNKRVHAYDENKNWIEQLGYFPVTGGMDYYVTVTVPNGCQYLGISYAQADGQLQVAKGTDTTYHAYNGTTSNIPFGQTVANGVLDITSGKLRVTHGVYNLTGTENWSVVGSGTTLRAFVSGLLPNKKVSANGICNNFTFGSANNQGEFDMQVTYLRFNIYGIATTKDEFNAWIANNPVMVVYELDTPIEIQLDSITLQALLNENNIWCDTGDTEVKFLLTVGKAIS